MLSVLFILFLFFFIFFFFFFKQKTAYEMRISDWSSDVCSSDLLALHASRSDVPAVRLQADQGAAGGRCQLEIRARRGQERTRRGRQQHQFRTARNRRGTRTTRR